MKSVFLQLMAVVLTVMSFQVSHPESDFYFSQVDTLQAIPLWDAGPIQSASSKSENKILTTSSPFVASSPAIAREVEHITPEYYLPIYQLHREKEYFLLI